MEGFFVSAKENKDRIKIVTIIINTKKPRRIMKRLIKVASWNFY